MTIARSVSGKEGHAGVGRYDPGMTSVVRDNYKPRTHDGRCGSLGDRN